MSSEIKCVRSLIYFCGLAKRMFLVQKHFFVQKVLSPFRSGRTRKRTFPFKKLFSFKIVILLEMGHFSSFSAHFWLFWLNLGLKTIFSVQTISFGSNNFSFRSGRTRKKLFERKIVLNEKSFFERKCFLRVRPDLNGGRTF